MKSIFSFDFSRQNNLKTKLIAILVNPGVQALLVYRLVYFFHGKNLKFISYFLWRLNHSFTGVDIAPGAIIGKNVIIYHTYGIVIGSTAVIKDNVKIMHGVTLGALNIGEQSKRHPTIENNVLLGANCTILGDIVVGANSKIGSNTVVNRSILPNSTVVGQSSRIITNMDKKS